MLKEKVFRRLYKELPYEVQIEDVSYKTLMDGSIRIEKNLMVRSDQVIAMSGGLLSCISVQTPLRSSKASLI